MFKLCFPADVRAPLVIYLCALSSSGALPAIVKEIYVADATALVHVLRLQHAGNAATACKAVFSPFRPLSRCLSMGPVQLGAFKTNRTYTTVVYTV